MLRKAATKKTQMLSLWGNSYEYKKYNNDENNFLSEHKDDAKDIKTCFDWLHENHINNNEYINKVKKHYKKLAVYLELIAIENEYNRINDHAFAKDLIDRLIADEFKNDNLEIKNEPSSNYNTVHLFKVSQIHLRELLALLAPVNQYAYSLNIMKQKSLADEFVIIANNEELNAFMEMMVIAGRYKGRYRTHDGIHEIIKADKAKKIQLKIPCDKFKEILATHDAKAPRFSTQGLEAILAENKDEATIQLNNEELFAITETIMELADFQRAPPSFQVKRDYKVSAAEESFRQFLKNYSVQFLNIEAKAQALAKAIFGNKTGEYLLHSYFGYDKSYLNLISNPPLGKEEIFAEVVEEFVRLNSLKNNGRRTVSEFNAKWLLKWSQEESLEDGLTLAGTLDWLNKQNLATQKNCEDISKYVRFIERKITLFDFNRASSGEINIPSLKQFMFNVYIVNLSKKELASRVENEMDVQVDGGQPPNELNHANRTRSSYKRRLGD